MNTDTETAAKTPFLRSFFSSRLPLFILAHFAHHIVSALPTPLLPMIRNEFSLDYTRSGFVISAYQLSNGFAQIPSGWLADRIGLRFMLTLGISGVALAGILVGLSSNYTALLVSLILMGVLGGGYHPSSAPLIADTVKPENRGRALGLHMTGGSASFFLAPIVAASIATAWGWRAPFFVLAAPTLIFGIIFYFILKRRDMTAKPVLQTAGFHEIQRTESLRNIIIFLILSITTHASYFSIVPFIPLYMVDHFGAPERTASAAISLIFAAGFWASPISGYLSDRFGRKPIALTACFIAGPVIYLLTLVPYGIGFAIMLVVFGTVQYFYIPVTQAYIVENASEKNRSTLLGIYFFGNIETGGLVAPALGYGIDRLGFHSTFTIFALVLFIVSTICVLLLRKS